MKKQFLLLAWLLPFFLSAQYAERERRDKVLIKDVNGYILEKRSIDRNGDFVIEDPSGRIMQIITKDQRGNIVVLDGNRQVIEVVNVLYPPIHNEQPHYDIDDLPDGVDPISISKDIFGHTVYERDGKTILKVGLNIFNEKFVEDGNGRQLRKFKRDIFDNKIVEGENGKEILKMDNKTFNELLHRRNMNEQEWEDWMIENFIQDKFY